MYINFKDLTDKDVSTPEKFLEVCFSEKISSSYFGCVATYNDSACSILNCNAGKRRSINAIYELVNSYFTITYSELVKILMKLNCYVILCPDIKKFVITRNEGSDYSSFIYIDERHNSFVDSDGWNVTIIKNLMLETPQLYCDVEQQESLYEFLKIFFKFERYHCHPTYYDKDFRFEQCRPARRSFEDLLALSKTYYPNTTEKELIEILHKLNEDDQVVASFCGDIEKLVFLYIGNNPPGNLFHDIEAEYRDEQGLGKYSVNILNFIYNE